MQVFLLLLTPLAKQLLTISVTTCLENKVNLGHVLGQVLP